MHRHSKTMKHSPPQIMEFFGESCTSLEIFSEIRRKQLETRALLTFLQKWKAFAITRIRHNQDRILTIFNKQSPWAFRFSGIVSWQGDVKIRGWDWLWVGIKRTCGKHRCRDWEWWRSQTQRGCHRSGLLYRRTCGRCRDLRKRGSLLRRMRLRT